MGDINVNDLRTSAPNTYKTIIDGYEKPTKEKEVSKKYIIEHDSLLGDQIAQLDVRFKNGVKIIQFTMSGYSYQFNYECKYYSKDVRDVSMSADAAWSVPSLDGEAARGESHGDECLEKMGGSFAELIKTTWGMADKDMKPLVSTIYKDLLAWKKPKK